MEKPSVESIIGTKKPFKAWHVESFTDIYGTFIIDELNEACVDMIMTQDSRCVAWVNGLDLIIANMIAFLPVMIPILNEVKDLPDTPPDIKVRILKVIAAINNIPDLPDEGPIKKKKKLKRKEIERPKKLKDLNLEK